MRFSTLPRLRRSLALLSALWCASNCRSHPPAGADSNPAGSSGSAGSTVVPERAEAVASADAWAVAGSKQGGRAGAQRLLDAARLRERIFRADHREGDALEAIELYRQAARGEPAVRCSSVVSAAVLEGELKADPELTFQAVYRVSLTPAVDEDCKQRVEQILGTLSAFRPAPAVLAQIEREGTAAQPTRAAEPAK